MTDNVILASPGRVWDVMLLSAVSVANIDCLDWADQPLLAGAELRSCQAQPRPGDSPAVVSSPGLAASSILSRHNC